MAVTTPDWLARHDGVLQAAGVGDTYVVLFGAKPQYLLTPIPLRGQHGCSVVQTVNGRRLDGGATYPSAEDAIRGGLDDLRKALGW